MKPFMRRVFSLCAAVFLSASAMPVAVSAEATTYSLTDIGDSIKIVGRSQMEDTGLAVYTTGAGIAFYSECSGDITLTLTARNRYTTRQYFTVTVDGVRERVCVENPSNAARQSTITLAENLDQGYHRIEVYRQTEEVNATCVFNSLTLNGTVSPVPEAPLLIEFVGDSITAGASMFRAEAGQAADDPACQDGTQTYAYQTAQALGADFQACCTSGYGVVKGWNSDNANLLKMYPFTAYHVRHQDKEENYWPFARQADVVVINLGTNDNTVSSKKKLTKTQFQEGATALMELVREKNPDSQIVWATGMMGTFYEQELTAAVEELGGAEAGYYFCELPKGTGGGAGHPNLEQHTAAAKALTEFLQETVLPQGYRDTLASEDEMQSLIDATASLTDDRRLAAQAELTAYRQNGGTNAGTMTAAYTDLLAAQAEMAPAGGGDLGAQEENGLPAYVWWIIGGGAVIVVGLILFAVVYTLKHKEPEGTSPKGEA